MISTQFVIPGKEVIVKDFSYTVDNDTVIVEMKLGRNGDISNEQTVNIIVQPTRLNDAPGDLPAPVESEVMFDPGDN